MNHLYSRGIFVILFLASTKLFAQPSFFTVDERKLIETKWKYTYTLHLESNTIIHRAERAYEYFLYFQYDYSWQQFLNGTFSKGNWSLTGSELGYSFKHIPKFNIFEVNKKVLVLEFNQPNSKGTYQYHFVKVNSQEAPFKKPINELPEVNVEGVRQKKQEKKEWALGKSKSKEKDGWWIFGKKSKEEPKENLTYINIEVTGGGFYGGINPTLRDYILIKNDGRLIKEYKSVENGLVVTRRNIPREELEDFAEYIVAQKFFEMERLYDCEDLICEERKKMNPAPIPLRLAIAYGDKRKVITVSIWGKDARNMKYVDYPPVLDNIIAAIQKMSYRMDPS